VIDWVHVKLPYAWETPIHNGSVARISRDGEVLWQTHHAENVPGSFDSNLRVSTREMGRLEISGNPAKWLQGHNLVGTLDLIGLVVEAAIRVLAVLEQRPPTEGEVAAWRRGDFRLSRVHINRMFELPNIASVRTWIRAAADQASIKYKRSQSMREGTLYIGKQATGKRRTNWFFKIYCKHDEMCKHELHPELPCREELYDWSKNLLRVELEINTEELKRNSPYSVDVDNHDQYQEFGYDILPEPAPWNNTFLYGRAWLHERFVDCLFDKYFSRVNLGDNAMIELDELEKLPRKLQRVYSEWKGGLDFRAYMSDATYYRYKAQLLKHGIDISAKPANNVILLKKYVAQATATPVETPSWIKENPVLYFRPRRAA
jgi:II/X family phage/plasmid replication protein